MSAPFDTLQLARGFEAARFPLDQASKMAAATQVTIGVDLASKRDLKDLGKELKLWLGTLMVVVATLLFAAPHYIPPTGHG